MPINSSISDTLSFVDNTYVGGVTVRGYDEVFGDNLIFIDYLKEAPIVSFSDTLEFFDAVKTSLNRLYDTLTLSDGMTAYFNDPWRVG